MKIIFKTIFFSIAIFSLQNFAEKNQVLCRLNGKELVFTHEVTQKYESLINRLKTASQKLEPDYAIVAIPLIYKYITLLHVTYVMAAMKALPVALEERKIERNNSFSEPIAVVIKKVQEKYGFSFEADEIQALENFGSFVDHLIKLAYKNPTLVKILNEVPEEEVQREINNCIVVKELYGLPELKEEHFKKCSHLLRVGIAAKNPHVKACLEEIINKETQDLDKCLPVKFEEENIKQFIQERAKNNS